MPHDDETEFDDFRWIRELTSNPLWWESHGHTHQSESRMPLVLPDGDKYTPEAVEEHLRGRDAPPDGEAPYHGLSGPWQSKNQWEHYYLICVRKDFRVQFRDRLFSLLGRDETPFDMSSHDDRAMEPERVAYDPHKFFAVTAGATNLLAAFRLRDILGMEGLIEYYDHVGDESFWRVTSASDMLPAGPSWRIAYPALNKRLREADPFIPGAQPLATKTLKNMLDILYDRVPAPGRGQTAPTIPEPPKPQTDASFPSLRTLTLIEMVFHHPMTLPVALDMNTLTRDYPWH